MAKKMTNEEIIAAAKERGYIEEKEIALLKKRGNAERKDPINYGEIEDGLPVFPEQGRKALAWLRKFLRKKGGSPYGYREEEIIKDAKPEDFIFRGFYNAGNRCFMNLQPICELNGMEYVPLAEPYIIG